MLYGDKYFETVSDSASHCHPPGDEHKALGEAAFAVLRRTCWDAGNEHIGIYKNIPQT